MEKFTDPQLQHSPNSQSSQSQMSIEMDEELFRGQSGSQSQARNYSKMLEFVKSYENNIEEIQFQFYDNLAQVANCHTNMGSLFVPEINDNICAATTGKLHSIPTPNGGPSTSTSRMVLDDELTTENSPRSELSQMNAEQVEQEYEKMVQHLDKVAAESTKKK